MKIARLNGTIFENMIKGGFRNLRNHEKKINEMNVFPVPDGDTGYNMRKTLEAGINYAKPNNHLGAYLEQLSRGMLWGARGNSGVILSQLFKGMSNALINKGIVNAGELRDALVSAYKTAYSAVEHPVEGTMLTVAREGVENVLSQIRRGTTVDMVLSMYLAEMKKSVKNTPDILATLKEAGVLDSGAVGYIAIVEGMTRIMFGSEVDAIEPETNEEVDAAKEVNLKKFDKDSAFEYGYCLEFLLQLMSGKCIIKQFSLDNFKKILSQTGNSIVAIQSDTVIKVHIHTFKPEDVIGFARKYGEFITFKLENMQVQHVEFIKGKIGAEDEIAATSDEELYEIKERRGEYRSIGIVAVADGEGVSELLKGYGADIVIDGGQTMNVSVKDFVDAYKTLNCGRIVVFPNNRNTVQTALQSAKVSGLKDKITVIPTDSVLECYYALVMGSADIEDEAERVAEMKEGAECVSAVSLTRAQKVYSNDMVSCKAGDLVAFYKGEVVAVDTDLYSLLIKSIKIAKGTEDKNSVIILKGGSIDDVTEKRLINALERSYPELDRYVYSGGQSVYDLIIGLV